MSSSTGIVWLNTAETARRLGVTPRTLYRFIDEGQLPAYRFGRVIRLKETEVEQFIDDCRIAPGTLEADTRYSEDDTESEISVVESSLT
jgi:excisionase family DNA binding protein